MIVDTIKFGGGILKIEALGDEKIIVALSNEDMHELDITYDEMDYSNIETRRVIWTILDEARQSLGRAIDTEGRLLIEVTPGENGGCVMYFTAMPQTDREMHKKLVMKKDAEPLLFSAENGDAFLDAVNVIKRLGDSIKYYEAYELDGEFFYIIFPQPSCSVLISYILSEYGDMSMGEKSNISEIYEYGSLLIKGQRREETALSVSEDAKI